MDINDYDVINIIGGCPFPYGKINRAHPLYSEYDDKDILLTNINAYNMSANVGKNRMLGRSKISELKKSLEDSIRDKEKILLRDSVYRKSINYKRSSGDFSDETLRMLRSDAVSMIVTEGNMLRTIATVGNDEDRKVMAMTSPDKAYPFLKYDQSEDVRVELALRVSKPSEMMRDPSYKVLGVLGMRGMFLDELIHMRKDVIDEYISLGGYGFDDLGNSSNATVKKNYIDHGMGYEKYIRDKDEEVRCHLASVTNNFMILDQMADDDSEIVRGMVASRTKDEDIIDKLSRDESSHVRMMTASNPLANHLVFSEDDFDVVKEALMSSDCSDAIAIVNNCSEENIKKLASVEKLPTEVFEAVSVRADDSDKNSMTNFANGSTALLGDLDEEIRAKAVVNAELSEAIKLSRDESEDVRMALAGREDLTKNVVKILASDPSPMVRAQIARYGQNRLLSKGDIDVTKKLLRDDNDMVRASVIDNDGVKDYLKEELINDDSLFVRRKLARLTRFAHFFLDDEELSDVARYALGI